MGVDQVLRRSVARHNWPKTLLIVLLVATFIALGFWQIDRLAWRRGVNAELRAALAQPPLDLNAVRDSAALATLPAQPVTARGAFDYAEQIALRFQTSALGRGVHLVAPFVLDGTQTAVLVDRGWIDNATWEAGGAAAYDEPLTTVDGILQRSQPLPRGLAPATEHQTAVFQLNVAELQAQMPYELLPIYVLQTAARNDPTARPYRTPYTPDIGEGNHLSYAVQWFSFAAIAVVGYAAYLRRYG